MDQPDNKQTEISKSSFFGIPTIKTKTFSTKDGNLEFTETQKINFAEINARLTAPGKKLYTEFSKHPTYYIGSTALRLAVGAGVGYGMYYGLTALAAPYLAPVVASTQAAVATQQVVSPIMQKLFASIPNLNLPNVAAALPKMPAVVSEGFFALTNIVPKAISAVSALSGLLGITKLSDKLLTRFFGEIRLKAKLNSEQPGASKAPYLEEPSRSVGVLNLFGIDKPYITPVNEIASQLEQELKTENKDKSELLAQSKTFALAYTKQLVETKHSEYVFDAEARAEVNTKPYTSASKKAGL